MSTGEGENEVQRGAYRHQSLIIYRPSLSPPMPNHLSTHLTPLLQNKTTPHFHLTSTKKHSKPEWYGEKKKKSVEATPQMVRKRKEEKNGAEGVEMRGWKACGGVKMGCISTPMPNHLSTHLFLPLNHIRVETTLGRAGEKKRAVWIRGRSDEER